MIDAPVEDDSTNSAEQLLLQKLADLQAENRQQHQLLDQARKRVQQFEDASQRWQNREQGYENLLEEKSDLIRQLHIQIQETQRNGRATQGPETPDEDELIALHQELEREREQLKQDEAALMEQVRGMEVQMSRERAEMARQKNELHRLQNELKHQLEIASRDAALRERLAPLHKLQEDIQRRRQGH
jgi:chromosome segregation ATPase